MSFGTVLYWLAQEAQQLREGESNAAVVYFLCFRVEALGGQSATFNEALIFGTPNFLWQPGRRVEEFLKGKK